jgi:hypothetical protein
VSLRHTFSDDEWQMLQFLPFTVFFAVGYADGSLSRLETGAFVNLLKNASALDAPEAQLVREVCSSANAQFAAVGSALDAAVGRGLTYDQIFLQGRTLLEQRMPPDQAQTFKQAMVVLATQVAEAALLIGKKVTDQERAAVEQIGRALGA